MMFRATSMLLSFLLLRLLRSSLCWPLFAMSFSMSRRWSRWSLWSGPDGSWRGKLPLSLRLCSRPLASAPSARPGLFFLLHLLDGPLTLRRVRTAPRRRLLPALPVASEAEGPHGPSGRDARILGYHSQRRTRPPPPKVGRDGFECSAREAPRIALLPCSAATLVTGSCRFHEQAQLMEPKRQTTAKFGQNVKLDYMSG